MMEPTVLVTAMGGGAVKPHIFLDEHHHAERNDDHADPLDEVLQRAHHLRLLRLFGALGLLRQARDVGIRADVGQLRAAQTADDEAAREELVAGIFPDLVRLARDECLVDVAALGRDHGIGIDLVAGGKDNDVVAHELRRVHGHALAVAHGDGFGDARMLSLSSVFFERSSCTMPMAVLTMMTTMNVRFSHCCTAITHSASRKNSMLK